MSRKVFVVMVIAFGVAALVSWLLTPVSPSIRLLSFDAREGVAIFEITNHSDSAFNYLGFDLYDPCVTFRLQTPNGMQSLPEAARVALPFPSYQTIAPRSSITCSVHGPMNGSITAISVGMHFKPGPAEDYHRFGRRSEDVWSTELFRIRFRRYLSPPEPTWCEFFAVSRADDHGLEITGELDAR
jgi:hypothetical protein